MEYDNYEDVPEDPELFFDYMFRMISSNRRRRSPRTTIRLSICAKCSVCNEVRRDVRVSNSDNQNSDEPFYTESSLSSNFNCGCPHCEESFNKISYHIKSIRIGSIREIDRNPDNLKFLDELLESMGPHLKKTTSVSIRVSKLVDDDGEDLLDAFD